MKGFFDKIKKLVFLPGSAYRLLHKNEDAMSELFKIQDMQYRDILQLIVGDKSIMHNSVVHLKTDFPIAYESKDYLYPFGTMQDNTRSMSFYKKCKSIYGEDLNYLDLGCSGGGLVFDFAFHGHLAIGLEGSDYSKKNHRANWRTIPENLFTCDVTKPFELLFNEDKSMCKFKVISCWEVLEHIDEKDLEVFFENVARHLDKDGIFVGSISKVASDPLHVTVRENDWWKDIFTRFGLRFLAESENPFEHGDYARGIGGGIFDTCNYQANPEKGFHFVARPSET